jgi:hypothetical protein
LNATGATKLVSYLMLSSLYPFLLFLFAEVYD